MHRFVWPLHYPPPEVLAQGDAPQHDEMARIRDAQARLEEEVNGSR
jgi:hypothetical protein